MDNTKIDELIKRIAAMEFPETVSDKPTLDEREMDYDVSDVGFDEGIWCAIEVITEWRKEMAPEKPDGPTYH